DGVAACWGDNSFGQLGSGSSVLFINTPFPVSLSTGFTNAVSIAAGTAGFHTCGLRADGHAFCWGENLSFQLGIGRASETERRPVQVLSIAGSISATTVTAGGGHTCAARADGTAACWGDNSFGQVGNGTTNPQPSPSVVRTNEIGIGPQGNENLKLGNVAALAP